MIKKTTNPKMTMAPRERGSGVRMLVEGEDFAVRCPDWCEPVADGAWPTEKGWYIVVSLITPSADQSPEIEPVWLEWQSWAEEQKGDGWVVNKIGSDNCAERRDFYWIGKIKMPDVAIA
jgi:hypothetical protein